MASMNVTVRTLTGSSIPLEIPTKGSIAAIRSLLQDHFSTSGSNLRIIFKNQLLTDSQSIESVGITAGSVIHAMCVMSAGFDIFVKTLTGKTITVGVKKSDLIREVKEQITDKEGIPVEQQDLIFEERKLRESETVESCGIGVEATLHLILRFNEQKTTISDAEKKVQEEVKIREAKPSWKVTVHTFTGETFPITANSQKVSGQRLKLEISMRRNISADRQRLYNGNQEVKDTTELDLSLKIVLLLVTFDDSLKIQTPAGETLSVKLSRGLSVSSIARSLEKMKGWKRSNFQLILSNRVLTDEREVLVKLTHRSELQVSMRWKLYIRDLAGRLCVMRVFSADSVDSLKEKLVSKFTLQSSNCHLSLNGKLLQGANLAKILGVKQGAIIDFDDFFHKSV